MLIYASIALNLYILLMKHIYQRADDLEKNAPRDSSAVRDSSPRGSQEIRTSETKKDK